MIYVDFINEVFNKLNEKYGIEGWDIKLFREGDSSSDKMELDFIHQTNIKYFGHRKDALDGDFIKMSKESFKGGTFISRFEVRYLFNEFKNKGWEQVFKIVDFSLKGINDAKYSVAGIGNYEEINNLLFVRPLNYEKIKEILDEFVYRKIGDIVIVLYMRVSEDEDNLISFKVHKKDVDAWGIDEEAVLDRALENSSVLYPAAVYKPESYALTDNLMSLAIYPFDIENDTLEKTESLLCTSTKKLNGSAVLFYPGLMEKFYKAFGNEDYYVAFTATTEFHLHSCSDFKPEQLLEMLRDNNERFADEALSNMIFRYHGDKNELVPVDLY